MGSECYSIVLSPDRRAYDEVSKAVKSEWVPVLRLVRVPGVSRLFLENVKGHDWVAFTSPRGPEMLIEDSRAEGLEREVRESLRSVRIAAVGPGTAGSVKRSACRGVDLVPPIYETGVLAESLVEAGASRVILVRSSEGSEHMVRILEEAGVEVTVLHAYKPVVDEAEVGRLKRLLLEERPTHVVLTSPMIARLFCSVWDSLEQVRPGLTAVCLGTRTMNSLVESCSRCMRVLVGSGTFESVRLKIGEDCGVIEA